MYIRLDHVDDRLAYSVIADAEVEVGGVVQIDGLAEAKFGQGEAFKGVSCEDAAKKRVVLVAPDNHRYEENYGDIAAIEAGQAFRGYVIANGQEATVEKAVIEGEVAVGAEVGANGYKLKVGANEILGQIVWVGKLYGRDMVKIMFI